jgi:hypothetical protein
MGGLSSKPAISVEPSRRPGSSSGRSTRRSSHPTGPSSRPARPFSRPATSGRRSAIFSTRHYRLDRCPNRSDRRPAGSAFPPIPELSYPEDATILNEINTLRVFIKAHAQQFYYTDSDTKGTPICQRIGEMVIKYMSGDSKGTTPIHELQPF